VLEQPTDNDAVAIALGLGAALAIIVLDVVYKKKSIAVVVAVCLGLIAGTLLELLVRYVVSLAGFKTLVVPSVELAVLLFFCYIAITIILQTREDFRFVIPYVKFQPQGTEIIPFVLDTSVIIDGRIADIAETGVLDNPLVVPRFVLDELQGIADSSDRLKRNRGRRGLDVLNRLQKCPRVTVQIRDMVLDSAESVDSKLVQTAKNINGRVVTNDFNLNKIAQLQGIEVINVNDLAQALRPVVLPGEELEVKVIRPGEEPGQGVGYLDDGTMVVVEQGRDFIGQKAMLIVSNVYQTSAGRMIFGRPRDLKGAPSAGARNTGRQRT
ncbi:MAG TPA: PIN domain-containing protein, partial [Planctomycetota bacterium]|nr:PIN domain-containing protein [Planctomycetota bacterium]